MKNRLFYGDNIAILREKIATDSVDLCYIDPPFNSKRDYSQIYNTDITEDKAQSQAFSDSWQWGITAIRDYEYLTNISQLNDNKINLKTIELIKGLRVVLGDCALMAYLVSMALRIIEIHRVLKPTGSFYLHCDPTASHYLKILCDTIFCESGGKFLNEIIWCYSRMAAKGQKQLSRTHDVILWYSKSKNWFFNVDAIRLPYAPSSLARAGYKKTNLGGGKPASEICELNEIGKFPEDWINIPFIRGKEYLGYPTQKPEALLERIIKASSQEGDIVLDAYCGCGTTIAVAERLNRQWIGIDITYQSISLILKRFQDSFGEKWQELANEIILDGIPKDLNSAKALANRQDDRLRKEFEKWAVLTYTNNQARINDKKGADGGADGIAYFYIDNDTNGKVLIQVKSGAVGRDIIAKLDGDMNKFGAQIGFLLTLENPTKAMLNEIISKGEYHHPNFNFTCPKIQIITIQEIINGARMNLPQIRKDIIKSASFVRASTQEQLI